MRARPRQRSTAERAAHDGPMRHRRLSAGARSYPDGRALRQASAACDNARMSNTGNETRQIPNRPPLPSRLVPSMRSPRRSIVPAYMPLHTAPLFARVVSFLLPWGILDYPGMRRGTAEFLAHRVSVETVRAYRKGRRRMPQWAADMLLDAVRSRVERGQALIAELEAYKVEKPRQTGAMAVDPATGQDRRHRIGRRQSGVVT